ncbi:MAG TPA: hypothetical protein VM939_15060, partial [Gemmatimonadaceae bacterium]|nr:hypothetical protein [Gemmatimonadaceae bacterium]
EPTGNLDANTGVRVFDLLESLNRESGSTIVLVTHDAVLAQRAARTIRLADGVIVGDTLTHAETTENDAERAERGEDHLTRTSQVIELT